MERARVADTEPIGHLRHVQPLFTRPLLTKVGGQLGVGNGGQTDEVLMLRASKPVPEISRVDDVKPAAPRLVDNRRQSHVAHPVAHRLITHAQELRHSPRRQELRTGTANDGAVAAQRAQPIPDRFVAALEDLAHPFDGGAVLGEFDQQHVVALAPGLALVLMPPWILHDALHIARDVRVD